MTDKNEMKKSIRKPLADAIAKYHETENTLESYRSGIVEAEATLAKLERDEFDDIEEAAELSFEAGKSIRQFEFKIASTERKLKIAKDKVETESKELQVRFNEAELEAVRKRLDAATAIIKSPEFEAFNEQLRGLYRFGGFSSWDSFLGEVLPSEPSYFESEAIAKRLFEWSEETEKPFEILQAKNITDIDPSTLSRVVR